MSDNDIDKLELAIDGLKDIIEVGEKVMADGKVDFKDSIHVAELYEAVKKCIEAGKAYKELGNEIKDIDNAEAIRLISKLFS